MPQTHDVNVSQTYLGLRLAMALLVGLLLASVIFQVISTDPTCLQRSISAYYYTSARPVFVASLCGVGALLIVYRGNTATENILLDFSGFLAFVVAFVPTKVDTTCEASNVPSPEELSSAVRNNVWLLLFVGVLASLLGWLLPKLFRASVEPLDRFAKWSLMATVVGLGAGALFFAFWPEAFQSTGHGLAAFSLFAGIVSVVLVNAWGFESEKGGAKLLTMFRNRYGAVAGVMVVTMALGGFGWLARESFIHWLFFLEAALILEFAVFWVIQTFELEGKVSRRTPKPRAP